MHLRSGLNVNLKLGEPLAPHTSFKIGGSARFYGEPKSLEDLLYLLRFRTAEDLPLCLLGAGCNTLVSDEGFHGLVLNMKHFEKDRIVLDGARALVSAGSPLHALAMRLREAGLGGLEFLAHLPGTVGGALVMNAGFGRDAEGRPNEIGRHVREVALITPEGNFDRLQREEIHFGYRCSSLEGSILLEAAFELFPKDPARIQEEMDRNRDTRERSQDWAHPSAGSVFKNPPHPAPPVGEMVERLGLKGTEMGGARISTVHGNFIVNTGRAAARDVLGLIELVRRRVRETYQIELETELKYVGS